MNVAILSFESIIKYQNSETEAIYDYFLREILPECLMQVSSALCLV